MDGNHCSSLSLKAGLVKEEGEWTNSAESWVSEAPARAGLYADYAYEVKCERVLGPEVQQEPDVRFTVCDTMCTKLEKSQRDGVHCDHTYAKSEWPAVEVKMFVKEEAESVELEDECEWSAAQAALYAGHEVKGELVLGPEGPQLLDPAFSLHTGTQPLGAAGGLVREPAPSLGRGGGQLALRDCAVRLERGPAPEAQFVSTPQEPLQSRPTSHVGKECDAKNEINVMKNTSEENYARRKTFILNSHVIGHVLVHIHTPSSPEPEESRSDEEIDVVSLGSSPLPLAPGMRLRTDSPPRAVLRGPPRARPVSPRLPSRRRRVAPAISTRPLSRRRHVAPAISTRPPFRRRLACATNRREPRTDTDTDSEPEAPKAERKSTHNDNERRRRINLKNLFDNLKKQMPATKNKGMAPKIVILREAVSLCRRLREEEIERECLRKRQNKLLARLKKLRTMSARYPY